MSSNSSSLQRDVARETGERTVVFATPYVAKNGKRSENQERVLSAYDLFLRLDGKGAHFSGAKAWANVCLQETRNPEMFFFLFMMLMCETTTHGSIRSVADWLYEPASYKSTVQLAARVRLNVANKQQRISFAGMTTSDRYVDLRFIHDVGQEELRILRIAEKKKKGAKGAKGEGEGAARGTRKRAKTDSEKELEPIQTKERLSVPPPPVQAPDFSRTSFAVSFVSWSAATAPPNRSAILLGAENAAKCARGVHRGRALHARVGVDDASPEDDDFVPVPYDGPKEAKVAKVTFTVTALPDNAGLYVRFLVRDPQVNPGAFWLEVCKNATRRRASEQNADKRSAMFSGAPELFPQYATFYSSQHPSASDVSNTVYFHCLAALCPDLLTGTYGGDKQKMFADMRLSVVEHPAHLVHILTSQRACALMRDAGVSAEFTRPEDWWNPVKRVASYPPDEARAPTFVYMPDAVFWYNTRYFSISEMYFPHIDMDNDFLATLVAGGNAARFLDNSTADERERLDVARGVLHKMKAKLDNEWHIPRSDLLQFKLLDYDTNNEFVHRYAEAQVIRKRVQQFYPSHYAETLTQVQAMVREYGVDSWRDEIMLMPNQFTQRVFECERYNEICNKAQLACTEHFCSLFQVDGNVDDLPIPAPIRTMLRWFRDNRHSKFPHVTREYVMWDPDLGLFGNSMLRQLEMYTSVARILQPLVCLLAEGLFSCYRHSPQELAFNLMLHGRYDTGKTFMAINALLKYTTIRATVKQYTSATPAADNTHAHKYDLIVASDEVMPYKVNSVEAKKVPHLVNKEKVKMTSRQLGLEAFVSVQTPNGDTKRWTQTITSDHYVAIVEVTNDMVEATGALSSRYHRMVVAQPRVPAREMMGKMGETLTEHTTTYLNLNQFLSAGGYKLMQCGGMLEPDLQLFYDISNRVIDYLESERAINRDQGARNLEIMKPYVIQLIIHMAIHYTFDMPCSPHYHKVFEPWMLRDMQPYLYATVDIVWWAWTALASAWVEEDKSNVLQACVCAANIHGWGLSNTSAYEMYERDVGNRIPWRLHKNREHSGDKRDRTDAKLVDLQYITLEGDFEKICHDIAEHTSPRLDWTDVNGILVRLSNEKAEVPGGAIEPQPRDTFAAWHKYTELPDDEDDRRPGIKQTSLNGNAMPAAYTKREPSTMIARTELDVPRFPKKTTFSVVDLSDRHGKKCIYVMPVAAASYRNKKIVEALTAATTCKTTRPGKILMGLPMDYDPTQMDVFQRTQAEIDAYVVESDRRAGYNTATGEWIGDPRVPVLERPVPRAKGLAYRRRGNIKKSSSVFHTFVPAAPVADANLEQWKQRAEEDVAAQQQIVELYEDLDYSSAKRQHMACGRPLDEPVRSTAWITAQYKLAAGATRWTANFDYPARIQLDLENNNAQWRNVYSVTNDAAQHRERPDLFRSGDAVQPRNREDASALEERRSLRRQREEVEHEDEGNTNGAAEIRTPSPPPPPSVQRVTTLPSMPSSKRGRTNNGGGDARERARQLAAGRENMEN
jgi:hypothetical protein